MTESTYDKFRKLLAELFMFDRADLDFGIYRIMNAKRDEVKRFLDYDLLPQVKESLLEVDTGQRLALQKQLEEVEQACHVAGIDPDTSQKVQDLRAAIRATGDPDALEAEVFSHLYNFFRRYYKDGDFISLRRYKEGVYAIPYEGEEVKLYWANHDQYYIKSGEYFRDYAFKLGDGRRVHFKLVQADEERDNTKAPAGQERRFILSEGEPIREEDGSDGAAELIIPFEYKPDPQKRKREALIAEAAERVLANEAAAAWLSGLAAAAPTEKNPRRTLLERHLNEYTARNTFDYFIHKDLGGFLRRELDFYIKNEVMHLDDIESEAEQRVVTYLAKIKAMRRIAHKIIDFLAQLENFQKKLWLKKKFVVETNWCVTLDRVPPELYVEIAANEAQRAEWVKLFAIDEIEGDLTQPGYSEPLTIEFLKANQSLVLDTAFFDGDFRDRLLASFEDVDEQIDGLLIHGDNTHALRLLSEGLREQVKCVYIDPPYNTGNDGFLYKDTYGDSSWLAMISSFLEALSPLAASDGVLFSSIDDNEAGRLIELVRGYWRRAELVTLVCAQLNPRGRTLDRYLAKTHEYLACVAVTGHCDALREVEKSGSMKAEYRFQDEKGAYRLLELRNRNPVFNRSNRPNLYYSIYADPTTGSVALDRDTTHSVEILPRNSRGEDGCWTWSPQKVLDNLSEVEAREVRTGGWRVYRRDRLERADGSEATTKAKALWMEPEINNERGKELVGNMFGSAVFDFPKSPALIEKCLDVGMAEDRVFLDAFAGSGTSGHAIINRHRRGLERNRYLLVELGDHFDRVLKPRILKALYSEDWDDGKPKTRSGLKQLIKYLRLESYEDALNNLTLGRNDDQDQLLAEHADLREDYTLRYMLDVESAGSASLLDLDRFEDPFSYTLQIGQGSVGETRPVAVDLVETFNYLIGLRVRHVDRIRGFKVVEGASPQGERVLVIWRNTRETSNAELDDFFQKQGYSTRDTEFDVVYVNGDNNLENLRRPDETWKVRLIEEDFKRLMFDVADV